MRGTNSLVFSFLSPHWRGHGSADGLPSLKKLPQGREQRELRELRERDQRDRKKREAPREAPREEERAALTPKLDVSYFTVTPNSVRGHNT